MDTSRAQHLLLSQIASMPRNVVGVGGDGEKSRLLVFVPSCLWYVPI